MLLDYVKFSFILACLLVAAIHKKPYPALFTAVADYFLVVRGCGEIGVTVFCAAHLCYAARFSGKPQVLPLCALFALPALAAAKLAHGGYIAFISAVYAQCLVLSLGCALAQFFRRRFARADGLMIAAGMLLFAGCDVCVAIHNAGSQTR